MKLHTRLLATYSYLVALVLVGAVAAALGFQRLGNDIGMVLSENFESVQASLAMLQALERQDSAVLAALLREQRGGDDVTISERAFLDALDRARANVTIASEPAVLTAIAERYEAYRAARDRVLVAPGPGALPRYEAECFPSFESVKAGVQDLLDLNHEAMRLADREAQRAAVRQAVAHALLGVLALLSMGLISQRLLRREFLRLEELQSVATAVAHGDLSRRASVRRTDELGVVAEQLNDLLDAQQEMRGAMEARLSRSRETILGLLRELASPAALLSLTGELVASTLGPEQTERVVEAAGRSGEALQPTVAGEAAVQREVAGADRVYRFVLLSGHAGRAVGWLARPLPEPDGHQEASGRRVP